MNQSPQPPPRTPAGTGGWSWPRLFGQLGVGPSAVSMLAWPYLHRLRSTTPPAGPDPAARS